MTTKYRSVQEKSFHVGNTTFVLDSSYSELKVLGQGSYGVVVSAQSDKLRKKVAIKKVTPVAKHVVDAKHVLREIRLLRHMGKHENIISLEDLFYREGQDELYIVMELMDTDLHQVIQSKQPLTEIHFQHFMYQLLCGLKYLHDNRIIHRDLKPGNLLVSRDCRLRITDFGLSRERPRGSGEHQDDNIDEPMTQHVVTRWYRPPELMLCPDGLYTYSVDIWSVGCIFAEMLGRNPLFPGKNFIHQLMLVFDVIGSPLPHETRHIINPEARKFLASQVSKPKVSFAKLYPSASPDAWWLLDQMLIFDQDKRISVNDALEFRYFQACQRQLPVSAVYPPVSEEFEFRFERENLTRMQLKQLIQREMTSLKREKQRDKTMSAQLTAAQAGSALEEAAKRSASVGRGLASTQAPPATQANASSPPPVAEDDDTSHNIPKRRLSAAGATRNQSSNANYTASGARPTATEEARKADVMGNYLKNTAASTTRSNSTSRLRPSSSTASSISNSTNQPSTSATKTNTATAGTAAVQSTIKARDVLREMMKPDAYDFLDVHTRQEVQHLNKREPHNSPKRIQPTVPREAIAASKVVKDVEESLTARLAQANLSTTNPKQTGTLASKGAFTTVDPNIATKDMISETIAAVLNSPSRHARKQQQQPQPQPHPHPQPQPSALPVPPKSPAKDIATAAASTSFGGPAAHSGPSTSIHPQLLPSSPSRTSFAHKKSLMETYTSPKRLVSNHADIDNQDSVDNRDKKIKMPQSPLISLMKKARSSSNDQGDDLKWARTSDKWEKLQAEAKAEAEYDSAEEKERNFLRRSAALRQSQQQQQQYEKQQHEAGIFHSSNNVQRSSHNQKVASIPLANTSKSRYSTHSSSEDEDDDVDELAQDELVPTTARTLGTQASTVIACHTSHHFDQNRSSSKQQYAPETVTHVHSSGSNFAARPNSSTNRPSHSSSSGTSSGPAPPVPTTGTHAVAPTAAVAGATTISAATTGAGGGVLGGSGEKEKRKRLTVPKSPKFSTMSWQKRRDAQPIEDEFLGLSHQPAHATAKTMGKARAASTGRAFSKHL